LNMKGTKVEEDFSGQALKLCVHGAVTSSLFQQTLSAMLRSGSEGSL